MTEHDPRIGLDFGDYKVTRKLAEGGMGAVYLAEHPSGMRKVVKFMLGEALKIPAIRKRFENECLAAKRFKGRSGIVEIDSFGERNGELYLVMEYLDGITLEEHIRTSVRLTVHHTYHVIVLCLRALSVLHFEGIVHRDLKPSNVFLRHTDERPWDPTLIDFGIVHDKQAMRTAEFGTREGQMIGTPGFMATEQYGQANKVTPATDIFACAVMVWLMLTGELPWGVAENEYAQYERQLNHRPVWPAHIPLPHAEGWKDVLVDALAPDPASRPSSAQLFALLLAQRLEPIPPHVPSGLEMVAKLAPKFLQKLPAELETVRQPNGRIEVAVFWPPRNTSALSERTPNAIDLDAIRVSAVAPSPAASAPTVSARPAASAPVMTSGAVAMSPMTTLSAATGAASAAPNASTSRTRLAVLGVGTALAIGAVTFGITRLGRMSSAPPESIRSTTPNGEAQQQTRSVPEKKAPMPSPELVATPADSGVVAPEAVPTTTTDPAVAPDAALSPDESQRSSTNPRHKKQTRPKAANASSAKPSDSNDALGASHSPRTTTSGVSGSGAHSSSGTFDPNAIKE